MHTISTTILAVYRKPCDAERRNRIARAVGKRIGRRIVRKIKHALAGGDRYTALLIVMQFGLWYALSKALRTADNAIVSNHWLLIALMLGVASVLQFLDEREKWHKERERNHALAREMRQLSTSLNPSNDNT